MTKSKKHSPQQTEDRTETILGQVPEGNLEDLIVGLVDLASSRTAPTSEMMPVSSVSSVSKLHQNKRPKKRKLQE